jgi:hypothetical protein
MNDHNPYEPPNALSQQRRDRNTKMIGMVSVVAIVVFVVLLAIAGAASFLLFQSGDPGPVVTEPVLTEPVEEPTMVPARNKEPK